MGLGNTLKFAAGKKEDTLKNAANGTAPADPGVFVVYYQGDLKCVGANNLNLWAKFDAIYYAGTKYVNESNRDEIKLVWCVWPQGRSLLDMVWEMEDNFRNRGDKLPWQDDSKLLSQ
jgi:hypothetical protein